MTRPIRIEFSGALYHVTLHGDRRESIYEDDTDRECFLKICEQVIEDFNWICHAYCLMTNHYHLVIETPDGNLSKGMRRSLLLFSAIATFSNKIIRLSAEGAVRFQKLFLYQNLVLCQSLSCTYQSASVIEKDNIMYGYQFQ